MSNTPNSSSNHLVVGCGEIGSAIRDLLDADALDVVPEKSRFTEGHYGFVHICFGYSPEFIKNVEDLQSRFTPKHLVIHSTVPVGTSEALGAVHSPMRGKHPHMLEGLKAFVKYFGGPDADACAAPFKEKGVQCTIAASSRTTEAMKLWDTTQYGWNIILEKMIWDWCDKEGVDFDIVYTDANRTYNEGYEKLGHPEYKKYVLKHIPGKMGGHCVVQNTGLFDSEAAWSISIFNSQLP
jgi:hypothetical protein